MAEWIIVIITTIAGFRSCVTVINTQIAARGNKLTTGNTVHYPCNNRQNILPLFMPDGLIHGTSRKAVSQTYVRSSKIVLANIVLANLHQHILLRFNATYVTRVCMHDHIFLTEY